MDKIITQDVYIPVDVNERLPPSVPVPFTDSHSTHWLEKKEGMIVLTKQQFEKAIEDEVNKRLEKAINDAKFQQRMSSRLFP